MEDRVHKVFFESNSYNTPDIGKLGFWKRLLSHNQVFFTLNYLHIVFRTRKQAIMGRYDDNMLFLYISLKGLNILL